MYDNQVWENKTKVIKLEQNNGSLHGILFEIKPNGLRFLDVIKTDKTDLEKFIKKCKMKPTNKVLTI